MIDLDSLDRPDATLIQRGLAAAGHYSGTHRGLPGPRTKAAYAAYRAAAGDGVPPTGQASSESEAARLRAAIVAFARAEVGVTEQGGNNRGARIDWYEEATWLDPSKDWAWCASFVCRAVWEGLKATGIQPLWDRPRTPAAYGFRDRWGPANAARGISVLTRPGAILAGDILVYTFSHCGIAVRDTKPGRPVDTVEGNTNAAGSREGDGVYVKTRLPNLISAAVRIARV